MSATETPAPDYIDETIQAIQQAEESRTFGRPSVMTPRAIRRMLEAIERGNFVEPACHYAGISYTTLKRWLKEGEQDETEQTPQFYFWTAVQRAAGIDEVETVSRLQKVAKDTPRFYMADIIRLSRRHRDRWAERTADELRAASTPSVQVLIGIAPPGTPQNPMPVTVQARTLDADRTAHATLSPSVSTVIHSVSDDK